MNAPYWVDEINLEQEAQLDIEAGVELAMRPVFGSVNMSGNSRLRALGTTESRVRIYTGVEPSAPPTWVGIRLSGNPRIELNYVDLSEGPIRVRDSPTIALNNARISGQHPFGLDCPDFGDKTWQIELTGQTTFNGAPGAGASPDC